MKTVAKIINEHGGIASLQSNPVKIEVAGFMRLRIEHVGTGPRGLPMISVAHYYESQGDLVADPDATFEVAPDAEGRISEDIREWGPVYIQHGTGLFVEACWRDDDTGKTLVRPRQIADLRSFGRLWSSNLRDQGFLEAFRTAQR